MIPCLSHLAALPGPAKNGVESCAFLRVLE